MMVGAVSYILPRWLLRKHNLFAREIALPNG
jgi:hypothetical protein